MWIQFFTFTFSFHVFINFVVLGSSNKNGRQLSPIPEHFETTHQVNFETRYPPFTRSVSANDVKKSSVPHFLKDTKCTDGEVVRSTSSTEKIHQPTECKKDEQKIIEFCKPNFSRRNLNLRKTQSLQHITGEIVDLYHKGKEK